MPRILSKHAHQRFWDVHAWAGVLGGLLLYIMCVTGSITLFNERIQTWEQPLAQQHEAPGATLQKTANIALQAAGTEQDTWLFLSHGNGLTRAYYKDPALSRMTMSWIDTESEEVVVETEYFADFMRLTHFFWHESVGAVGYIIAGLLSVMFLLILVTGVLIHLRNLTKQFHQFRPESAPKTRWLDLHKVLGVLSLPYQLMYAYTGAMLILGPLILQGVAGPVFDGNQIELHQFARGYAPQSPEPATGPTIAPPDMDTLVQRATSALPGLEASAIMLHHHGHSSGTIDVWGHMPGPLEAHGMVRVRESDGTVVSVTTPSSTPVTTATKWLEGLHFGAYGGVGLQFVYFFLGLILCATIITGNWLWLARRQKKQESRVNIFLRRVTAGVGAGTWLAVAVMLVASRTLPFAMEHRRLIEELTFIGALALAIGWSFVPKAALTVWWQQLGVSGVLLTLVPILAARVSSAGLFGAGPHLAGVVAVDVVILGFGLALCAVAYRLRRRQGNTMETMS